jgi:Sigma-70, region 4
MVNEDLSWREVQFLFEEEVQRLPIVLRSAFILCCMKNRSSAEVARELGVKKVTVFNRVSKARKLLLDRLAARGIALSTLLGTFALSGTLAAAVPAKLESSTLELIVQLSEGPGPTGVLSDTVASFLKEVKPIMTTKMKMTMLLVLVLGLGIIGTGLLPTIGGDGKNGPNPLFTAIATAAPVPPNSGPKGEIWVNYQKTGKLVALTPEGRLKQEIELEDSPYILRISPAEKKIWFAGIDGRMPELGLGPKRSWPNGRITLHTRKLEDTSGGTDLEIEINPRTRVFRNGKTVGLVEQQQNGNLNRSKVYELSLIDIASKRVTKVELPGNYQALDIASNGKWVLALERNIPPIEQGTPPYRIHKVPLDGTKPTLLSGSLSALYGNCLSPDGTKVLTFPINRAAETGEAPTASVYVIDVETAKAVQIAGHEKQLWSAGAWSPDGKQIVYAWRARNDDLDVDGVSPTRLVVCDADGRHSTTILTSAADFIPLGWW